MKVTKDEVVRALLTEPLLAPNYFADVISCRVCAVGAVLRNCAKMSDKEINHYGDNLMKVDYDITSYASVRDVKEALEAGNHMAALSAYFEGIARGNREETVQFVLDNFPSEIEI